MLNDRVSMKLPWRIITVALTALIAAGCTTQRNPRYCGDGVCIDPAYPFCDTEGAFGDLRQQCVAVACTPADFIACRGDDELRCEHADGRRARNYLAG